MREERGLKEGREGKERERKRKSVIEIVDGSKGLDRRKKRCKSRNS